MSLASFRLSSRLRKSSAPSPKKLVIPEFFSILSLFSLLRLKYWDKESAEAIRETEAKAKPRGELDFLNMDQLINIRDLESSHGPKRKF